MACNDFSRPNRTRRLPGWGIWHTCRTLWRDALDADPARKLEDIFSNSVDPWNYGTLETNPRLVSAAEVISKSVPHEFRGVALEIGCAEGLFTGTLSRIFREVVSVDVSPTALSRARRHISECDNVEFLRWDLRASPALQPFDLIVATDVLEYFQSRRSISRARAKILQMVRPGGYFLLSNSRHAADFEAFWWAQPLVKGGMAIDAFFSASSQLTRCESLLTDDHVMTLFRCQA